jgi:heat shock protein HslJ
VIHSGTVARLLLAGALQVALPVPALAQDLDRPDDEIVPEGVRWELRAHDGPAEPIDVLPGTGADLVLESGRASFNGGCDLFFGEYALDGDTITFGDAIQRTDRSCSDEAVVLQNAYLLLLHQVASWRPYFGAFQLLDASGEMLLEFSETTVDISQRDVDDILARLAMLSDEVASLQARVGDLEGGVVAGSDGETGLGDDPPDADAGETEAIPASVPAAPRARVEVERRYTYQDPDQARGLVTWRDRSADEDGFRVYARRIYCGLKAGADPSRALAEEDFTEKRSRFVRVASLPADATRFRPRHAAIMEELPSQPIPRYGTGAAYDLYVVAFNEAGESERTPVGSYTVTPEWFCP